MFGLFKSKTQRDAEVEAIVNKTLEVQHEQQCQALSQQMHAMFSEQAVDTTAADVPVDHDKLSGLQPAEVGSQSNEAYLDLVQRVSDVIGKPGDFTIAVGPETAPQDPAPPVTLEHLGTLMSHLLELIKTMPPAEAQAALTAVKQMAEEDLEVTGSPEPAPEKTADDVFNLLKGKDPCETTVAETVATVIFQLSARHEQPEAVNEYYDLLCMYAYQAVHSNDEEEDKRDDEDLMALFFCQLESVYAPNYINILLFDNAELRPSERRQLEILRIGWARYMAARVHPSAKPALTRHYMVDPDLAAEQLKSAEKPCQQVERHVQRVKGQAQPGDPGYELQAAIAKALCGEDSGTICADNLPKDTKPEAAKQAEEPKGREVDRAYGDFRMPQSGAFVEAHVFTPEDLKQHLGNLTPFQNPNSFDYQPPGIDGDLLARYNRYLRAISETDRQRLFAHGGMPAIHSVALRAARGRSWGGFWRMVFGIPLQVDYAKLDQELCRFR